MTTYMNIDAANRRVEIGSTWYRRAVQRSAVNTEAKRLLLAHAFDTLGCIAVEFRTHTHNHASRHAIERLGAKLDGVLRAHQINRHPDAPKAPCATPVFTASPRPNGPPCACPWTNACNTPPADPTRPHPTPC